jgi:tetratricopeptide (TPR) repeat protein
MEPVVLGVHSSPLGESPPPPPRHCFGRDDLIREVVRLAENLEPIALIGAGGIGKTSISLTVLHLPRIQGRFGDNRRFIRCDQFPASRAHFLARLSEVIGAGIENPEDLTSLRPFLSSKKMFIVLDNAESILDPQETGAREIYTLVDELFQFKTLCVLITSRITTVPWYCERPKIGTLSIKAARDIFYGIYSNRGQSDIFYGTYSNRGQSDIVDGLLKGLHFHALSITLFATAAFHNGWDHDQLAQEWDTQRAQVLRTDYNESLAATIELSLGSPVFRSFGPDARDLLGVIALFPQGIYESNLDRVFPTISNRRNIFDGFCILSLTHRSNGFVTMLAPIRDYLGPRDPRSSPLFCATRDRYFNRLSVGVSPGSPGFKEGRWIMSEDVNVEYLLDVSTSTDPDRDDTWVACCHFMEHLYWHKPRQTILRLKIEALAEDHRSKSKCLSELSRLFGRVRNYPEQKQLLARTLELDRRSGNNPRVAQTLLYLSDANRLLGLHEEGIRQAKESLEILEWINHIEGQTQCLNQLAWLLFEDNQLDPAEDAASHAIGLASEKGQEFLVCQLHRVLGKIHSSKGEKTKAIHHFETALGIASPPNWDEELFWIHHSLAEMFGDGEEFDDANAHIGQAKLHAADNTYRLGRAMGLQANVWCLQLRLEDAKSEALHALEFYEKCGAVGDAGVCRDLLRMVERAMA